MFKLGNKGKFVHARTLFLSHSYRGAAIRDGQPAAARFSTPHVPVDLSVKSQDSVDLSVKSRNSVDLSVKVGIRST
jgi:hypothetical protein